MHCDSPVDNCGMSGQLYMGNPYASYDWLGYTIWLYQRFCGDTRVLGTLCDNFTCRFDGNKRESRRRFCLRSHPLCWARYPHFLPCSLLLCCGTHTHTHTHFTSPSEQVPSSYSKTFCCWPEIWGNIVFILYQCLQINVFHWILIKRIKFTKITVKWFMLSDCMQSLLCHAVMIVIIIHATCYVRFCHFYVCQYVYWA